MQENVGVSERPRGRPPETSHDAIRDVAITLFLEQGFAKTSLASIASAAGISRTTLFSYFPSKRDLIWEDHDRRDEDVEQTLAQGPARPVVDLMVRAMLAHSSYRIGEHALLASRVRIAEEDDELRAYSALAQQRVTERISQGIAERVPEADPGLIALVTRALVGAASRCTEEWAALERPSEGLDAYTARRIAPITHALRPLLP